MPFVKISELPDNGALAGTEELPIVQGGVTKRVTLNEVKAWLAGANKAVANIGDGVSVNIPVVHNLGSRDVIVSVYRNTAPYDEAIVDNERTDANTVTLKFGSPPSLNQWRVVITG